MAPSLLNSLCAYGLVLTVVLAAQAQNEGNENDEELLFDSESLTLDRQTNLIELKAPVITQGSLRIVADEALATGTEFEDAGEWRLTGDVRITVDGAVIEASSAVFTFANRRLSRGELVGAPATFSDVNEQQQTIHGRAEKISYDYIARTLRMTGDAWVQLDNREILGCDLIYDFAAERVTSGSANCAYRVRILPEPNGQTAPADPPR
jgi:lipopolysaccharide transport protein LptA